jgi:hypothetical protein
MSFFQKIEKPSHAFFMVYNHGHGSYNYKLNIFGDGEKCPEMPLVSDVIIESNNLDYKNIDQNLFFKCNFEGTIKDNPISAFWHYNQASLPSFFFAS